MGSNRLSEKELEIVKLGVDEYNGVVVPNFSSEDRNKAIRGKFFELFGTDRPDAMDIEEHKYKMFRIMREVIQETITNKEDVEADFFNRFVEKRVVALGDSVEFEIENIELINKLFLDLKNQFEFITIGNNLAFNKNELKYIVVKEKR